MLSEGAKVFITGRKSTEVINTFNKLNNKYQGKVLHQHGDLNSEKTLKNIENEALFNTPLYTRNIENAYIQMYKNYYKGLHPNDIVIK